MSGAGQPTLRAWQQAALDKYLGDAPQDFLAVATPGAGKTTFGLRIASELLAAHTVARVVIVAPTEHLKHQWAEAAARAGIRIDSHYANSDDRINPTYDGVAVTYAQVAAHPFRHQALTAAKRTLVILDEIHHGGDAKSWGQAIADAYGAATRRLSLTGTPFRSDDAAIPFVTYTPNDDGLLTSRADHTYGYSAALRDGVVRPVVFLAYSGEARWRTSAGEEFSARLGQPLNAEQTSRAWRTALNPAGEWIPAVLKAADTRLEQLRSGGMSDAGGLVIASDKTSARAYARILTRLTGDEPAVILSDEPGSSERIAQFSASTEKWMVAVRMVSEGVDVPRLAVGVYATSACTPLFFAQAIGRFVRSRRPGETASVFLPSVPVLLDLASRLEAERDHVIGQPDREDEFEDELLLEEAQKRKDEPGNDRGYESLGAEAELDALIYDGSTYGTVATTEEEESYLGLPGLLDAEQMRALLRQRQAEQLDTRTRSAAQTVVTSAPSVARAAAPGADELPALRKELNALVALKARKLGRTHGAIHNEIRRQAGGPPTALCSAEQLRDRMALLRAW